MPVEGQDANGLRGTSHIGIWTDITPPGVPHLIDPSRPHPVNLSTYPVKGTADPGSQVVLLVGATTYTTTAGNELGVWEIPASLATGPNSLRAKARDAAGNESPWSDPIILTLDQTPPGLATSVSPEWQRPSQPVTLTAVVTETDLLYWGDVWAAVSGPDPATQLSLTPPASQGGNPWQTIFLGGVEGSYSASLKARDRAGNTISQTQTFILDGTPPALAVTLSSAPPYGHVEGSAIYYGEGSGVFTLTAVATDTLSKLGQLIFPATTSSGQTYTYEGLTSQTQVHTYAFTTASTFSGNLTLEAIDRAGNLTSEPFSVSYDNVAPTPPTVTVPSAAPATFSLSWTGQDSGAGVRHYDVQVRDAITSTWTPWLTGTTSTEAQFTGSPGHSYYFQVRATDQVNNTGAWQQAGPVAINAVTKYYTFGSQRVAMRQGDEVYYLHGDHLGSTSLTTDGSGVVMAEARYLPYGQERWRSGVAVTDFGFTGQRQEAGFGLMDYKARYYDSLLGRFVSPDTVVPGSENPQAWNRYTYVFNNPVKYTDSTGHCIDGISTWVCLGVVFAGIALLVPSSAPLPEGQLMLQQKDRTLIDNPSNGAGCTASLAECHKAGLLKEFKDQEQINPEEFNELLDVAAEEVYLGFTPGVGNPEPTNQLELYQSYGAGGLAGRGRYDTPFYNGGGAGIEPFYPSDQQVCFGEKCYGRSAVNYFAQGMWGADGGDSWAEVEATIQFWNQHEYNHPASEDEIFWAKYGYDYYTDWLTKKHQEWNGAAGQ